MKNVKVAVIQATPIIFNIAATIDKSLNLISAASEQGAELVVFPESFIPGYPRGMTFGAVVGKREDSGRQLYQRYWENSIEEKDEYFHALAVAAKKSGIYLAMGATERDSINGSLYCSYLYFAPDGTYLGKHRKIKPTGTERIVWAEGSGDTLTVIDSDAGKFGGLICWENYMPLARYALYQKGIEIYLAPTADARDSWQSTLRHIALESRSYVLGCNQYVSEKDYPDFLRKDAAKGEDLHCRGGSVIISPLGETLAGPVYNEEKILFAELEKEEIVKSKMDFDVVGHYARHDIFNFEAIDQPEIIIHRKK